MAKAGTTVAPDSPADITQEVPLGDTGEIPSEGDLPPEVRSFWRRRRGVIIAVVVVLLAGAGGLVYWLTSGSSTPTGLVVTTTTVPVTTGTIQQTVASSGTIEPASQASLNFAVSGTVTAVNVKAGQSVTAGQVLATVDTTALSEEVSAAQAQLAAANARLASDEASSAVTTQIDSDQAAVTSAESTLSNAQTALNDAALTSTIAGTVASVDLNVGQQVSGSGSGSGGSGSGGSASSAGSAGNAATANTGSSTGTGSSATSTSGAQIVVVGTDSYIVNTTVDDTEIGQISDGDQADIVPTGSTTTVYGTVASVSLIGSESSNVTTFPVVIDVTGDPTGLYAGSTADVSIIVKQLNDVTEVPTQAISYNNGQATVTQVVNGSHVVKTVTVGAAASGETQITSGVEVGDLILERTISFRGGAGGTTGGGLFGGGGAARGRFGGGGGFTGGGGFGGGGGFTGGGGLGGTG